MRLIDADALIEELGEEPLVWNDTDEELTERSMWRWFRSIVESAPSVEQSGYVEPICLRKIVDKRAEEYEPEEEPFIPW